MGPLWQHVAIASVRLLEQPLEVALCFIRLPASGRGRRARAGTLELVSEPGTQISG